MRSALLLAVLVAIHVTRSTAAPSGHPTHTSDKEHQTLFNLDNRARLLDSGTDVWFEHLSEAELAAHWSYDDGATLSEKIASLQQMEATVSIDVKLVGFRGEGNRGLHLTPSELTRYFDAMDPYRQATVLRPRVGPGGGAGGAGAAGESLEATLRRWNATRTGHTLQFRSKYVFHVSVASPALTRAISRAIATSVKTAAAHGGRQAQQRAGAFERVPISVVNDLIEREYQRSALSYTIYVLNPTHPKLMAAQAAHGAAPSHMNAAPRSDADNVQNSNVGLPDDSSTLDKPRDVSGEPVQGKPVKRPYVYEPPYPGKTGPGGRTPCMLASWVGRDRYAWFDLTAGPVTFGPQTSGDGIATELTFPRLERLAPVAKNTVTDIPKHEFIAELVAAVRKTADLLITPSIDHFPVEFKEHIAINILVISDKEDRGDAEYETTGGTAHNPDSASPPEGRLLKGWGRVVSELQSLAFRGQTIDVITHRVNFYDCELCVAAYTHSLKSHTSNVMSDGLRTQVHQYLDSSEMHDWLEHFDNQFWSLKETTAMGADKQLKNVRVLSAFVYDLKSTDILLLDRFHQAVAFEDMVLAVQTTATAAVVDFSCNGESAQFDPRDARRPVLASILQTIWGVAPTHEFWNPLYNASETDYLWSVGHTPFGYFSTSEYLSFAQRDAAARHVVLTDLNHTMSDLSRVLEHFSSFGREIEEVLSPADHLQFVRRWNVLTYKLSKTRRYFSLHDFEQALFYMRSAHHDLEALHELVHTAGNHLRVVYSCAVDDAAIPSAHWSKGARLTGMGGLVALFFFLLSQTYEDSWLRRLLCPRKKRKFF